MAAKQEPQHQSGESVDDLASDVINLLKDRKETVAVSESLTGGAVMAALTAIPGSGSAFRGGVVSYATPLKRSLLNVDDQLIDKEGVVHQDVAAQMAEGARNITALQAHEWNEGDEQKEEEKRRKMEDSYASWGIGTTGVAGPDHQDGKPAGTVYIGIASEEGGKGHGPFRFGGGRDAVRESTVKEALALLRAALKAKQKGEKL